MAQHDESGDQRRERGVIAGCGQVRFVNRMLSKYEPVGPMYKQYWLIATSVLYFFAALLVSSAFDLRQSIVYLIMGLLLGIFIQFLVRSRRSALAMAIGLPLALTTVSDFGRFEDLLVHFRVGLGVTLTLIAMIGFVSRRWVFALVTSTFLIGTLTLASMIKLEYVGVPLIWHDLLVGIRSWDLLLEMETDKVAVAILILLIFPFLWRFEPSMRLRSATWVSLAVAVAGATVAQGGSIPDQRDLLDISFNAERSSDGARALDPIAVILGSWWRIHGLNDPVAAGSVSKICCLRADRKAERLSHFPPNPPHVVAVLLESTFDPHGVDSASAKGAFFKDSYALNVHTVGGGTWVAEYALLHGVPPPIYGAGFLAINLLGPGQAEGRLPMILRSIGYSNTTIYPVAGRFYGARIFHHSLGMESFFDCGEVAGCEGHRWRDRSDRIFLSKAMQVLARSVTPQFIFLPTIQQHSPHDGVKVGAGDTAPCSLSQKQCLVMRDYRSRLDSSLADFHHFQEELKALDRDTVVLAFGDHIPGDINRFFDHGHLKNGRKETFFTVWHSRRGYLTSEIVRRAGNPKYLDVAFLDWVVAAAVGLDSEYFRNKEAMIHACGGAYCLPVGPGTL